MIENEEKSEEGYEDGFHRGCQMGQVSGFNLEDFGKLNGYKDFNEACETTTSSACLTYSGYSDKEDYGQSYREGWRKGYEYGYNNGRLDRTKMESYKAGYSHGFEVGKASLEGVK